MDILVMASLIKQKRTFLPDLATRQERWLRQGGDVRSSDTGTIGKRDGGGRRCQKQAPFKGQDG